MHRPQSLRFSTFSAPGDPLVGLERDVGSRQVKYLRCYLHDLGARAVVIEPNYFDRDYLSEFEAFYATSSAGYPNICQRAHYFAEPVTRTMFAKAIGGDPSAQAFVQGSYLGHVILRPIPGAPIGRTVLRVYADEAGVASGTPRVMEPARDYEVHIAGLTLKVSGLAWQQQDTAVGACATVALWSMLHSSAFDDHHAIPTTAKITSTAHGSAPTGNRTFPADSGLQIAQILEVIKSHDLAPVMISGDLMNSEFSQQRFCTLVASFIRSGYPVLVSGWLQDTEPEGHTICIAGFRSPKMARVPDGDYARADEKIDIVYVHDDNLGPNARFRIQVAETGAVSLIPESPEPQRGKWPTDNPTKTYHEIVPTEIVVAVHQELRTDPLELQRAALTYSAWLPSILDHEQQQQSAKRPTGMVVASRFIRLHRYVEGELSSALVTQPPTVLSRARLALWEKVAPLSLHIGLVRVSLGTEPMIDILFDTSDNNRHLRPTAYVAFQQGVPWLLERWNEICGDDLDLGTLVRAW